MHIWDVLFVAKGDTTVAKLVRPVRGWTIEKATAKARKRLNEIFGQPSKSAKDHDKYQLIGVVTGEARNNS